jgi:hypothetical protein
MIIFGYKLTTMITESNHPLIGKRICLIKMEDPYPIAPNEMGTIMDIDGMGQLQVKWDCGRTLAVIPDLDEYEIEV